MFTPQEIAAMSAAEAVTAREMNAAEESGRDLFMDDEPHVDASGVEVTPLAAKDALAAAPAPAEEPAPAPAADAPAATPAVAAEEPAATSEPAPPPPEPSAAAPALKVETIDFDTKRKALRTKEHEIEKKWSGGEINDDERVEQLSKVRDEIDELLVERTRAETITDINKQNVVAARQAVIEDLRKAGPAAGLDYGKDTEHSIEFDAQLRALSAIASWQAKPFAEAAKEAHRRVIAIHGKAAAPAPPTPAAPAPTAAAPAPASEKKPPEIPPTLRDLPSAARANVGDDITEQWAAATGPKAEALWKKMTPAQQARALGDD